MQRDDGRPRRGSVLSRLVDEAEMEGREASGDDWSEDLQLRDEANFDEPAGWPTTVSWIWYRWGVRRISSRAPELLRRLAAEVAARTDGLPGNQIRDARASLDRAAAMCEGVYARRLAGAGDAALQQGLAEVAGECWSAATRLIRAGERHGGLSLAAVAAALDPLQAAAPALIARELAMASGILSPRSTSRTPEGCGRAVALPTGSEPRQVAWLALYWAGHAAKRFSPARGDMERFAAQMGGGEASPALLAGGTPALPGGTPGMKVLHGAIPGGGKERTDLAKEWSKLSVPLPLLGGGVDTPALRAQLGRRFPHFLPLIDRIAGEIEATSRQRPWIRLRPFLLIGPSGIGKTFFVEMLASAMELPFRRLDLSGATDNRTLAGTASGWSTAQPCFPLFALRETKAANPLLLMDGIDRAGGSERTGDPRRTLDAMTDRQSAARYMDECLMAPVDLSGINWVACANSEIPLRGPLLNRFRVIHVEAPEQRHYEAIVESVRESLAEENGLDPDMLPRLDAAANARLRREFGRKLTVRGLHATLSRLVFDPKLFPPTLIN